MAQTKTNISQNKLPDPEICIENAKQATLKWAKAENILIERIDLVYPSIRINRKFSVWLFFDTDQRIRDYEKDGTIDRLKDKYHSSLAREKCPKDYLEGMLFFTDSNENVQRFANLKPLDL